MGAPKGNSNAATHRGYARVALDGLPFSEEHIRRTVVKYRKGLEAAVRNAHGSISPMAAELVNAACRHETICRRWAKRRKEDGLKLEQELQIDALISRETDARIKCVTLLKIDEAEQDVFASLYQREGA